jgi:ATP-dependent Lon protease
MSGKAKIDWDLQRRLTLAVADGDRQAAWLLMAGGADPDHESRDNSLVPFHAACIAGPHAMRTWLSVSRVKTSHALVVCAIASACLRDCLPASFKILVKNAPYALLREASPQLLGAALSSPDHSLLQTLLDVGLDPRRGGRGSAFMAAEDMADRGETWARDAMRSSLGERDDSMDLEMGAALLEAEKSRNSKRMLDIVSMPSFDEPTVCALTPAVRPVARSLLTMNRVTDAYEAFVSTPMLLAEFERSFELCGLKRNTRQDTIEAALKARIRALSGSGKKPGKVAIGDVHLGSAAETVKALTDDMDAPGANGDSDGIEEVLLSEARKLAEKIPAGAQVELFDRSEVKKALAKAGKGDRDVAAKLTPILQSLLDSGSFREAAPAPGAGMLDELDRDFPHFAEATQEVRERLGILAAVGGRGGENILRLPNILLAGNPGVGKTHYVRRLSEMLGTGFHDCDMSRSSAGWVLGGLDPSWSGGKPGKVFGALADGPVANPIFFLDEIDKAGGDSRHQSDGPLYALLERKAASKFTDEFAGVPVDASHILWFAAANDLSAIKKPILSRFSVHEIPDPTPEQSMSIARSVYRHTVADEGWHGVFDSEPAEDALAAMAALSARDARKVLLRAFGKACAEGASKLRAEHFPVAAPRKNRIGF